MDDLAVDAACGYMDVLVEDVVYGYDVLVVNDHGYIDARVDVREYNDVLEVEVAWE